MNKIPINGVELAYQVFGRGPNTLVFVHGYGGMGGGYKTLFNALSPVFTVIALDMRGHGKCAHVTQDFSFRQMARDIVAAVDVLGVEKPVYAGHSMGGVLGLLSELEKPGIFQALVLITSATASGAKGVNIQSIEQAVENYRNKTAMKSDLRAMYVKPVTEDALVKAVDGLCLVDPQLHQHYLRVEFPNLDITARLHEIKPPVLFLNGGKDTVIPPDAQHQTAVRLPNFKEVLFSGEGHMMPVESPQRTAREIIRFVIDDLNTTVTKPDA